MAIRLFNLYKKFALVILPRFYRKIPKIIWAGAAVSGIFFLGFASGFFANEGKGSLVYQDLEEEHRDYLNLINGYEELSNLYYYQGQNVASITNLSLYETNPGQVAEAYESSKEYKDKILVQQGRILEQRKNAGLLNE